MPLVNWLEIVAKVNVLYRWAMLFHAVDLLKLTKVTKVYFPDESPPTRIVKIGNLSEELVDEGEII